MKESKQCPKCASREIIYLPVQPELGHQDYLRTRPLGYIRRESVEAFGALEAFVCTGCGYHETYVRDPDKMNWGELQGAQWVNPRPDDEGPYR